MDLAPLATRLRIAWYRRLWTAQVEGSPELRSPVLLAGLGRVRIEDPVIFGWEQGPGFHSGYTYIEARDPAGEITIGAGSHFNNGVTVVSDGAGIAFGRRCLVGPGTHVYDSDFHEIDPARRHDGSHGRSPVRVGDDVFIGSRSMILKGVEIGDGCVIAAGSVVTSHVPPLSVAGGNPARVLDRR